MENGQIYGVYSMRDLNVKEVTQVTGGFGRFNFIGRPSPVLPSPIEIEVDSTELQERKGYNEQMLSSGVFGNFTSFSTTTSYSNVYSNMNI